MDALKPIYGSLSSKESLISGKKWSPKLIQEHMKT